MVSVRGVAPVANDLESADHLADGEETDHLGGDDADLPEGGGVLVPYAGEEGLGVVGDRGAVEESGRVLDALGERLEVALDGLDGAFDLLVSVASGADGFVTWGLRRSHVAAADNDLAELTDDAAVVESGRDHAW